MEDSNDLFILDQNFDTVDILDTYKSLIWTDRFNSYGDFEVSVTPTDKNLSILQTNRYIWRKDSEHLMVIENIQISTDVESGNFIIVSGRSLESIIDRRIVWSQTRLRGKIQGQLKKLFDQNIINPTDNKRRISNFTFQEITDPVLDSITIDKQYTGDNMYELINELCEMYSIGFKITLREDNVMVFQLYSGTDRSYSQFDIPYVVFSPGYENLISSNYETTDSNMKTIALVAGENKAGDRRILTVGDENITGVNRRELFVDARDIQSEDENGNTIPDSEYNQELRNRGNEKMLEYKKVDTFDGEVSPVFGYLYDKDYFLGDICQIENQFGIQKRVRVIEYIRSKSDNENSGYPTFEVVEEV